MYNEMVVLKLVQSMTKLISSPPEVFKDQIHEHFRKSGENFYKRIKSWMELSEIDSTRREDNVTLSGESDDNSRLLGKRIFSFFVADVEKAAKPDFPLIPASKGFCLTLVSHLEGFYKKLKEIHLAN